MLLDLTERLQEVLQVLEAEGPAKAAGPKLPWGQGLQGTTFKRRTFPEGATIAEADGKKRAIMLIVSGWAVSGKVLNSGMRSILDISVGGDVVITGSAGWTQETIIALSPVTLVELPGSLFEGSKLYPAPVSEFIAKGMARRHARLAERVMSIGRREAAERTAHLLLELAYRLAVREKDGVMRFDCPLTQADLGDTLGLSAVHVNRVLRRLRDEGYVSFRSGVVEIHDRSRLIKLAGFDPSYLELMPD